MSFFHQLGYQLAKSAVARWRTPAGLAAIAARGKKLLQTNPPAPLFGAFYSGSPRQRALRDATYILKGDRQSLFSGLSKLYAEADRLPVEKFPGHVTPQQPPKTLYRGITRSSPWQDTQLGPGRAHGTPHLDSAYDYGGNILGRRLVSQHAASPVQKYGPDWSAEAGHPGFGWRDVQQYVTTPILRDVDDQYAFLTQFTKPRKPGTPDWVQSLPEKSVRTLFGKAQPRQATWVERLLQRLGWDAGTKLPLHKMTYETAMDQVNNPLQKLLLVAPGVGQYNASVVPDTARWQSIIRELTRTQ